MPHTNNPQAGTQPPPGQPPVPPSNASPSFNRRADLPPPSPLPLPPSQPSARPTGPDASHLFCRRKPSRRSSRRTTTPTSTRLGSCSRQCQRSRTTRPARRRVSSLEHTPPAPPRLALRTEQANPPGREANIYFRGAAVRLIQLWHTLEKQLAAPEAAADPSLRAKLLAKQQAMGGLDAYQVTSALRNARVACIISPHLLLLTRAPPPFLSSAGGLDPWRGQAARWRDGQVVRQAAAGA